MERSNMQLATTYFSPQKRNLMTQDSSTFSMQFEGSFRRLEAKSQVAARRKIKENRVQEQLRQYVKTWGKHKAQKMSTQIQRNDVNSLAPTTALGSLRQLRNSKNGGFTLNIVDMRSSQDHKNTQRLSQEQETTSEVSEHPTISENNDIVILFNSQYLG